MAAAVTRARHFFATLAGIAAIVLALVAILTSPRGDTIDLLGWAIFSAGVGIIAATVPVEGLTR